MGGNTTVPLILLSSEFSKSEGDRAAAAALRCLDHAVLLVDAQARILEVNDAMRAVLGWQADDERPQAFGELWDEDGATQRAALRRAAGSTAWSPLALTRRGRPIALRGRAVVIDPHRTDCAPHVLFTAEPERQATFEAHNELVAKLNEQLAQGVAAKRALERMIARETMLRRELIHRVKNNLAMLTSLVRLSRRRAGTGSADAALAAFEGRVLSIGAVHDILDNDVSVGTVRADEMVIALCNRLTESFTGGRAVALTTDVSAITLSVDQATSLALVINEAVTNALKHAFPGRTSGRVHVALRRTQDGRVEALIADDGIGVHREHADGVTGTGSAVIKALAAQLGGSVERHGGAAADLPGLAVRIRFASSDDDEVTAGPA